MVYFKNFVSDICPTRFTSHWTNGLKKIVLRPDACVYIHTCVYTYMHTYIHTSIHTYVRTYIHDWWFLYEEITGYSWFHFIIKINKMQYCKINIFPTQMFTFHGLFFSSRNLQCLFIHNEVIKLAVMYICW